MIRYIRKPVPLHCFLIILVFVLLTTCKSTDRKEEQSPDNQQNATKLFNGQDLEGWEITSFGTQGPVQVTDHSIVLGMGDGLTGITWTGEFPAVGYQVNLDAMKISGNDFFCGITFPYKNTFCSFIAGGWGGPVVGLSTIDGMDASENETRTLMQFDKDRWYHIRLKVTEELIEAWIDSIKVVELETSGREISIRPEVQLSKPFGIASWNTTAALRNIYLEKLSAD